MDFDSITLVFQCCDSHTKIPLSLINRSVYKYSRSQIVSMEIAQYTNDVFSIIAHPNWHAELESQDIGKIGSVFLMELYQAHCEIDIGKAMTMACSEGNLSLVKYMLDNHTVEPRWEYWMLEACYNGSVELIYLMIERGARDWNRGLWHACSRGNLDAAILMLDLGATETTSCFYNACQNGHASVAKMLLGYGVDYRFYGLGNACYSGNMDIINLMIACEENNWNEGLAAACHASRHDVIKLMIKMGATQCESCTKPVSDH